MRAYTSHERAPDGARAPNARQSTSSIQTPKRLGCTASRSPSPITSVVRLDVGIAFVHSFGRRIAFDRIEYRNMLLSEGTAQRVFHEPDEGVDRSPKAGFESPQRDLRGDW